MLATKKSDTYSAALSSGCSTWLQLQQMYLKHAVVLELTACWRVSARADALAPEVTDKVYMDLTVGGKPAGRVVLGLFGRDVPRTTANFKALGG